MVAPFNSKNVFDRSYPAQFSCNPCKIVPNYYEEVYPSDHFRCVDETLTKFAPLVAPDAKSLAFKPTVGVEYCVFVAPTVLSP